MKRRELSEGEKKLVAMAREFENDREAVRDISQKHYDEIDDYDRLWWFISRSRCCTSGGRWGEFRGRPDGIEIGGPGAVPPPSGDDVDLRNVTSPKGLELPDRVAGSLYLDSLQTVEGLELPEHVGGSLILDPLRGTQPHPAIHCFARPELRV